MKVSVLFFATLKRIAGKDRMVVTLPLQANVYDLKERLVKEIPELEIALQTALASINRNFAFEEDEIPEDAEVAFFPPVSGGVTRAEPTICQISTVDIEIKDLLKKITSPSTGAVCIFTGLVRQITTRRETRHTNYLEYEAYQGMAEAKLHQVADEIRTKWPQVQGIAIVQRIGRLDPGMPTVMIACSAGHRDSGVFEAARYGIDRLKQIVPVWKKEIGPNGEVWVEGDYKPRRGD